MKSDTAANLLGSIWTQAMAAAPRVALVLAVLVGGVLLSLIARALTRWVVRRSGMEALAERVGASNLLYAVGHKAGVSQVAGRIVWLTGLLLTFAVVAELLGLPGLASGAEAVISFLPRLMAAGLILLGGLLMGGVLRKVILGWGKQRGEVESPEFVARLLYFTVVTVAVTMAVQQIGLETGLVNALVKITLGAVLFSLGLSFALASRDAFRNIIARHYLERMARPGDHIGAGQDQGIVLRYSAVSVIIKTETGEKIVPCRALLDQTVELQRITPREPGGGPPPE